MPIVTRELSGAWPREHVVEESKIGLIAIRSLRKEYNVLKPIHHHQFVSCRSQMSLTKERHRLGIFGLTNLAISTLPTSALLRWSPMLTNPDGEKVVI